VPDEKIERVNFEDQQLWNFVNEQFEFAKEHRDAQVNVWRTAESYLYGNHWKDSRMPNYKSKIVVNDVFEAIETMLPVITARAPKIEVVPQLTIETLEMIEQAEEYARGLEREFDEIWQYSKMPRKNREMFRMMKGYGNAILKSTKVEGQQRILNEVVDIFAVFPDPNRSSIRDCEETFFIHAPVVYISEIKKKYGVELKEDGELDNYRSFQFAQQAQQHPYGDEPLSPVSDTEYSRTEQFETTTPGVKLRIKGQALIAEMWYMDEDEDKYPNGRVTAIAPFQAKGKIIYDAPRKYKYIPFFGAKNYSEAQSFWGRPESEQIRTLNKSTNMIISQVVDNIRLTANPKYERLRAANIDKTQVTSEPGSGVLSSILGGFKWIDPPKMPRYVLDILNWLGIKTDNTTGVQDAWRGKSAGSGESGRHAEILRSQTAGRLQPPIEEQIDMIKEAAEHWNYIIQRMWKDPKVHVVKTQEGKIDPRLFHGMIMNPADTDREAIDARQIDFNVDLSVGSLTPHDKYQEMQEIANVITFATQGVPPSLLEPLIDASPNIRDKAKLKQLMKDNPVDLGPEAQLTPEDQEIIESGNRDAIALLLLQKPELRNIIEEAQAAPQTDNIGQI